MQHPARPICAITALFVLGAAAPSITSGHIATPTVDVTAPPPSPIVTLQIKGKATSVMLDWTGPSGQGFSQWFVGNSWTGRTNFQGYNIGTNGFELAFNLYTQPGRWTLSEVSICASALCSNYVGTSLASLFDGVTMTITNPNPYDLKPPVATSGAIKTPTLSISSGDTLQIDMRVKDNLSGVQSVYVCASTPGVFPQLCANSATVASITLSGKFPLTGYLQSSTTTGTYTISSVFLVDLAGNTSDITDAATISKLFDAKTSFVVSN